VEHGQPLSYLVDVEDDEFMQRRLELLEGPRAASGRFWTAGRARKPKPRKECVDG